MTLPPATYTRPAIALHWLMALLIAGAVLIGLVMGEKDILSGDARLAAYQLHKSIGFTILALLALRLFWRLTHPVPPPPGTMTAKEIAVAKIAHVGLYLLMLAVPLSGWAVVSSSPRGFPSVWFGLFEIPHIPFLAAMEIEGKAKISEAAGEVHETMAWILVALALLHAGAALHHHFFKKDDVLTRMIPWLSPPSPKPDKGKEGKT